MAINITDGDVELGLTTLVNQKGADYLYEARQGEWGMTCRYVHEGQPDCIVGCFLADQGVPLERLMMADQSNGGGGATATNLIDALREEGVITISDKAQDALQAAQSKQDCDRPWGEAVQHALRELA